MYYITIYKVLVECRTWCKRSAFHFEAKNTNSGSCGLGLLIDFLMTWVLIWFCTTMGILTNCHMHLPHAAINSFWWCDFQIVFILFCELERSIKYCTKKAFFPRIFLCTYCQPPLTSVLQTTVTLSNMDPVSPTRSQPLMDPLFNVIFIEAFGCGKFCAHSMCVNSQSWRFW